VQASGSDEVAPFNMLVTNGNTSHSSKTGNRFLKVETKKKTQKTNS